MVNPRFTQMLNGRGFDGLPQGFLALDPARLCGLPCKCCALRFGRTSPSGFAAARAFLVRPFVGAFWAFIH
jgi:hypothetical protein